MNTNVDRNFENHLKKAMSLEEMNLEVPDLSRLQDARALIASRKKPEKEAGNFFAHLFSFFKLELRFYHVGVSMLLICGGIFYLHEPNYGSAHPEVLAHYDGVLSLQNTTISVNSSTMLTSIPTLRY